MKLENPARPTRLWLPHLRAAKHVDSKNASGFPPLGLKDGAAAILARHDRKAGHHTFTLAVDRVLQRTGQTIETDAPG